MSVDNARCPEAQSAAALYAPALAAGVASNEYQHRWVRAEPCLAPPQGV